MDHFITSICSEYNACISNSIYVAGEYLSATYRFELNQIDIPSVQMNIVHKGVPGIA